MPEPGWYDDPDDPTILRWWDGNDWTEHAQPQPQQQDSNQISPDQGTEFSSGGGGLFETDHLPPWMVETNPDENEEINEFYGYDEDDEEFEDDDFEMLEQQKTTPFANLGSSPDGSWAPPGGEAPGVSWGGNQPDGREQGPFGGGIFSGEATGRFGAPVGPSAGSAKDFTPPSSSGPPPSQSGPFSRSSTQEVPPWIRDNDGPANRPVPPWAQSDEDPGAENYDSDDFYIDDDEDEDDSPGYGFMENRPTSWEEMSKSGLYEDDEDEDEESTEKEEKIKRYAFIGAGAAGVLLVLYVLYSIIFGGESSGGTTTAADGNTVVAEIGEWSDWPDPQPGYVVKFPSNPSVSVTGEGRKVLTSNFENQNYRVIARGIDPQYWESLPPAERIVFINSYLTEEFPGIQALLPIEQWRESSLGGKPARKMVFRWEGNVYTVITTFYNNFILATMTPHIEGNSENSTPESLLEEEVGDSKKFIDSWRWLPTPEPPAESEVVE